MAPMSESGRHGVSSSPEVAGRRPHPGWPNPGWPHPGQAPAQSAQPPSPRRVVVVVVDGSPDSGDALRQAASQARQRNALLEIVRVVPPGMGEAASAMARAKLGEFTRRECPYGTGAPVRLRVECGDPIVVLGVAAAEAELLINGLPRPPETDGEPETAPAAPASTRLRRWVHGVIPDPSV